MYQMSLSLPFNSHILRQMTSKLGLGLESNDVKKLSFFSLFTWTICGRSQ